MDASVFRSAVPGVSSAAKYPKCHHYLAKIEKIHGVSTLMAAVSPWISNDDRQLRSSGVR
jgi:hypothetical protein